MLFLRHWLDASITNRATALVAALTLGTVFLVGLANLAYVLHLTQEAKLEVLKDAVDSAAQRLGLTLDGLVDDSVNLARNPALISAALDSSDQQSYLRPILDNFRPWGRTPRALCVTDYKGSTLACTDKTPILSPGKPSIHEAIGRGLPQAKVILRDDLPPLLHIATPLVYFQSGRPEGALLAEYELSVLLLDAAGGASAFRHIQLSTSELGEIFHAGRHEGAIHREVQLKVRAPLDPLGLRISLGTPATSVSDSLIEVASAYLLLLLLLLPIILWLVRKLSIKVTGRLVRLSGVAESIAATGRLNYGLDDSGQDEIARLARSFATMTERVREINRDLEQRVDQRTRALSASEARIRDMVNTTDGIVWEADAHSFDFTFVSDQATRLLGYPQTEWLQPGFWVAHLHPEDRAWVPAYCAEQTALLAPHDFEYRFIARDGRTVWLRDMVTVVAENGEARWLRGLMVDVTARKQAEEALHQAASVFEHANEGIMITDPAGTILDVNAAFCRITGYGRDQVVGQNPRLLKSGLHDREFYATMWKTLQQEGHWTSEMWNRRKDGSVFAEMQTISAVRDKDGKLLRYVSLFSDITAIKAHQSQLERIAHFDALTGLPNRVLLADRLHQAMAQAQRRGNLLGVIYLDLDGFKAINDNHSHLVGDQLLTALAGRMKDALRDGDTLARLGGDEFVAVLLDLQGPEDSAIVLDRLLVAASEPVWIDGLELHVSASVGVSFYPQHDEVDADQLMRQADQAMYQAKQAGKNRYHVFDTEHDRSVRGHHESLERIRQAFINREFLLHYQPKVNMRSGQVIGAEALIRWQHPEQGCLSPAAFLSVIEGHPLSVEVGDWVIDTALTQIESWRRAGLDLPVSVNVDALQFEQEGFMDGLRQHLARHPAVRPGDLELEVLETSALEDIGHLSEIIEACRKIGVGFALDDFGTGYSSLTYLRRLPADLLKIDQSFVRDMLDDPEDLAILEGVLGLATAFRRRAIAEGVESLAHGEMLLQMGCELGQGYAIARPMPAAEIGDWISGWRPDAAWLNRAPVSRDDLPILFAIVEHRAWVAAVLDHRHEPQARPPMDSRECRFGQWLDHAGKARYADHPALAQVVALHEAIHHHARQLLAADRAQESAATATEVGTIEALRDKLVAAMRGLMN